MNSLNSPTVNAIGVDSPCGDPSRSSRGPGRVPGSIVTSSFTVSASTGFISRLNVASLRSISAMRSCASGLAG